MLLLKTMEQSSILQVTSTSVKKFPSPNLSSISPRELRAIKREEKKREEQLKIEWANQLVKISEKYEENKRKSEEN